MTYNPMALQDGWRHQARRLFVVTTALRLTRLTALIAILLIAVVTSCHSKPSGGELVLTAATDPGTNAFMPPAGPPQPTNTQPPPTLQSQGDGTSLATQPLPGDRDGLYGGTDNNAEVDRGKVIDFLGTNPAQAGAFVEALNTDNTVYWSGQRPLVVADIPTYLRELTPAVLRLDTRITNHGFDGMHFTTAQSVFQAGTAVLVDAHGVPRVRGLSGNPLTAPVALPGAPHLVGAAWPGYRAGALAEVMAAAAAITNFVLVDVVTGHPFNRPAGTTGAGDTPHTGSVAPPAPESGAPATSAQTPGLSVAGTYLFHFLSKTGRCGMPPDYSEPVTQQGNTVTVRGSTGPLNTDGSFIATRAVTGGTFTDRGVFVTESGRTVIRDGVEDLRGICGYTFTATKQ
jgi:hypothetical protein